jgi:hypothetical protein
MAVATQPDVFDEGNVLVFTATFVDELTQEPINPATVAFGYRVNSGAVQGPYLFGSSSMTNPETGTFIMSIASRGKPGTWKWQWESDGSGEGQKNGAITVTPMPMSLI